MPQKVNPGKLSTRVRLMFPTDSVDSGGNQLRSYTPSGIIWGYWENRQLSNAHGYEAVVAEELIQKVFVRLTIRYNSQITPDCQIRRESDGTLWRVLSINDWTERHRWMELRLERWRETA